MRLVPMSFVLPLVAGATLLAAPMNSSFAQGIPSGLQVAQSDDPFKNSYEEPSGGSDEGGGFGFGGESQSSEPDPFGGTGPDGDGNVGSDPDGGSPTYGQEPSGPTTDEEMGYGENKSGRTVVVYTRDASGRVIRSTHIHYDPQGKEIGRDVYNISPDEPQPPDSSAEAPESEDEAEVPAEPGSDEGNQTEPSGDLDGTYTGELSGDASAEITLTVRGSTVFGQIEGGLYDGDSFGGVSFSARLDENGKFSATVSRTIPAEKEDDPPVIVTATIEGQFTGSSAAGKWRASNNTGWGSADGSWWAN